MKKLSALLAASLFLCAGNLYFNAYRDIQQAKRLMGTDPEKSQRMFMQGYTYLKELINRSVDKNRPSVNAFKLMGEMYLNGWGVEKNATKAARYLCAAKMLGNVSATRIIGEENITCPATIDYKELKQ